MFLAGRIGARKSINQVAGYLCSGVQLNVDEENRELVAAPARREIGSPNGMREALREGTFRAAPQTQRATPLCTTTRRFAMRRCPRQRRAVSDFLKSLARSLRRELKRIAGFSHLEVICGS